ncbi:MAG TPA: translation factor GTPase family protein [Clostridiaceae bacterium]
MAANIKNIGIVAHVDAGKTTVTEQLLYKAGAIRTLGSVDKGTAHTDNLAVERERGISVKAAAVSFTFRDSSINLIDTPGHIDFSGEVERAIRVLDSSIMVISSVEGVQPQTEIYWKAIKNKKMPTIFFINKIDRVGSDTKKVLEEIKELLTKDIIPIELVLKEEGEPLILALEDIKDSEFNSFKLLITEKLAEYNEEVLEKYINGESLSLEEIKAIMEPLFKKGELFPLLYGCAIKGIGIKELLDAIYSYLPVSLGDSDKELSALIFKIERDKNKEKLAYVRIFNGEVKNRDLITNLTQNTKEKVNAIRKIYLQKYEDLGYLSSGDIGCFSGLTSSKIGDILGTDLGIPKLDAFSVPLLTVEVFPKVKEYYIKLYEALSELSEEDPLLDLQWIKEKKEIHIKIMGWIQLEIIKSLLLNRFNIEVDFGIPSVIYKETPTISGEGFVAYTMPKPCWAVIKFLIEPKEKGYGFSYNSVVRTEKIPARYQLQIEKALPLALSQGLYGWEVVDLAITLIDGEYHVMHTHAPDFTVATPMALMNGLDRCGTTILEPILSFRITVPEEAKSTLLRDIIAMRGSFESPIISKGKFTIHGEFPLDTSIEYPIKLGIITGGKGTIKTNFKEYKKCTLELANTCERRGVDPLDRAKYILSVRNAI